MLPVLQKNWIIDSNNQVPAGANVSTFSDDATSDRKQLLVEVKDSLVASGFWTVKGSSDASTSDASDLWVDSSDILWSDSASGARSWIVLVNTVLDIEVMLDCLAINQFNGAPLGARISRPVLSGSGGFDVGSAAFNTAPVATDEQLITGVDNIGWGTAINDPNGRDWVWNTWVSDDGEVTRVVMLSNGLATGLWMIEPLKDSLGGLDDLVVKLRTGGTTSPSEVETYTELHDLSTRVYASHPEQSGLPLVDGNNRGPELFITSEGFNNNPCGQHFTTVNDIDSAWGFFPAGIASTTHGFRGRMGELYDLFWGSVTVATGDTYPDDGSRQFVQFGDLIFPWDGSAPVVT